MVAYLSLNQLLELHSSQIRHYGGAKELRDRGALEAALARPAMTFGGEDLYTDLPAKAAALLHSLVLNHPFLDGNKRVGAHAAVLFLAANHVELLATSEELVSVTLATAEGKIGPEALAIWFRQHSRSTEAQE